MQEQNGLVHTLAKNLHSENGSTSTDAAVDCPLSLESLHPPVQNQRPDYWGSSHRRNTEWCFGESSSTAARRRGISVEKKPEHGFGNSFTEMRCEEHNEQSRAHVLDVSSLSSDNGSKRNDFVFFQNSSSEALPPNVYSSAEPSDVYPDGRSPNSINLIPGCSFDSWCRPQKRKASETGISHSSDIRGQDRSKRAEIYQWHVPPNTSSNISFPLPTVNSGIALNNRSGSENSRIGAVSVNPPLFTAESSTRSLNLDINRFSQQDLGPGDQFSTGFNLRNVESSSSEHSSRLANQNYLLDLSSAPRLGTGILNGHPPPVRRRVAASNRRASSRTRVVSAEGTSRNPPRSISDTMFLPGDAIRNSVTWSSAATGNSYIGGNFGSTSSAPSPFSSSGLSLRNSSRLTELQRSMLASAMSNTNHALQAANSSASQGITPTSPLPGLQSYLNNSRAGQSERLFEGALGMPLSMRALERRNIMSEQFRHVLDLMRRGQSLRMEDMMFLDHSILQHDRHRDMRMDVDNMSYEELLALEERIGSVCIGLSEVAIAKHLKKRIYIEKKPQIEEDEPCCICREEYAAGDDVGELNCGHDFHSNCIKQWLLQKNLCPICKTTGLKT